MNSVDGSISALPKSGGTPRTLVKGQVPSLQEGSMAVDAKSVYWATASAQPFQSSIREVPLGGGAAVTRDAGSFYVTSIAVDSAGLYWIADSSASSPNTLEVVKLTPK